MEMQEAERSSDAEDPMKKKYILCKYSEYRNGEVMLVKIREFYTEQRALAFAAAFYQQNKETRIVILTELVFPTSHWE